ncbi:major facilitator superfamily protein [Kitasatospora phosalacinea]|uniref:Major facilitator superfamily protein n=2 Tax=Kitasatospora phosalacinea TaxID=2065 RepID=A0A9W6URE0_9ACTN|nr:major facilitator superfamily protein [Kitasatospora phosalacinea]
MRPWRFVVWFGIVSLLADFVYEGARSVTGPLLASLGASAAVVGVVTGAGEAAALGLRLVSGPLADRTGRFWALAIGGYALTVVTVPLLGIAGTLGAACALVIAERVGKSVRSPAKDTLLSHATAATGRGRGFAVHEALDQVSAIIGPLTVAAVLAATHDYGPALGILAVPGAAVLALLWWLRTRVPDPAAYENTPHAPSTAGPAEQPPTAGREPLPRAFWVYAAFTAATMTGFATFGVLSFHLIQRHLLPASLVPVLYAAAMLTDAAAALATGWAYDRIGPRVLVVLPLLAAATTALAFTDTVPAVVTGALLWGAATGVQESTLRATVADLVPTPRRATAYGLFAAVVGAATLAGGALTGALYSVSVPALITTVITVQAAALALLAALRPPRT